MVDRVYQLPRIAKVRQLSIRSEDPGALYPIDLKLLLCFAAERSDAEGPDHG